MADEITVNGPDGGVFKFPAGTDKAVIQSAMQKHYAKQTPQQAPVAQAAQPAATPDFNPALHYPGTTPEQAAQIPAGFVFDPTTNQYRDVGLEAELSGENRGRMSAINSSAMQGVGMRFGDEMIGAVGNLEGRARGVNPEAMQNLRKQQARATISQDADNYPGTALTGEIAGAIALPGAAITKGAGYAVNTARAMGVGGFFGGATAMGDADGSAADRVTAAPVGIALGVAGGIAAVPVAKLASFVGEKFGAYAGRIMRSKRFFDGQAITSEGRTALEKAGINADEISEAFAREFGDSAARSTDPVGAARATQMSEFGIPAYRANVTGETTDFADFERARRGGMGASAATRVGEAGDVQMTAARRAGDDIATGVGGGRVGDQADAAVAVQTGLRGARDKALTTARGAYDDLEAAGGGVRGGSAVNLGSRIGAELKTGNVTINAQRSPNAAAALDDLDAAFIGAENGSVPFMDMERARQNLVKLRGAAYRGSLGSDQNAMDNVITAFDDKVDEIMTTAMIDGSEETLGKAQSARRLWREYSQTFTGKDAGSKFIQKMIDEDASPDDVAKWMFSAGRLGSGQFNSTLAKSVRETLGDDSEAWQSVRQGAFRQLIQRTEGTTQMGPQKMASNIAEFFNSPTTRQLSQELFSRDERGLMMRYAGALRQMVPPEGAVNHSNTAYELSRMGQQAARALAGTIGFASGGPAGAVAGSAASEAVQGVRNGAAVRTMLRPTAAVASTAARTTPAVFVAPGFEAYDFTSGLFQGQRE